MQSCATTVAAYLASLPEARRAAIQTLRELFKKHMDPTFAEGMHYGMVGYCVPHSAFPPGYHCDPKQPLLFAGITSQKNHFSLHLMCLSGESGHLTNFVTDYAKNGKKLDMGKSCVRFKKVEDLHLPAIARHLESVSVKGYVEHYQALLQPKAKPKAKVRDKK